MEDKIHALYRFFGHDDSLLYIGITMSPSQRWAKHADGKPWWTDVGRIIVEQHPNREAVLAAERAAIVAERPRYNVVHNRGTARPQPPVAVAPAPVVEPMLRLHQVVALGLADGRCPVGSVIESDEWGATLGLYHWLTGYFSAGTRYVAYGDIRSMRFGVPMSPSARSSWERWNGSVDDDAVIWDMDPLAEFQTAWTQP